jgi:HlyD family secretion protein
MKFLKLLPILLLMFMVSCSKQKSEVLTGEVDATEIDVGTKIPGRLAKLTVREGDDVKKGQILGYLESKELEAKLQTVQAALKEAHDQYDFAEKSYNRIKNLSESNTVSKQQFDEATYKYQAAKQKIEATEGMLNEVKANYGELILKAPIDGEVVQLISHNGEIISAGYPVLTIVDLSDQWITLNIREDKLRNITKGSTFSVELPALGKSIDCEVTYISALGNFAKWKATNEQGTFDLKTFETRMRPKAVVANMRPGMTALIKLK